MTLPKEQHLHFDCFAGVAGDMFLGAMIDLGVSESAIRRGLAALPLEGYELRIARAARMSIEGCDVTVVIEPRAGGREGHGHGHAHRRYRDIEAMIETSRLSPGAKARALAMFDRVARAESKMHGLPMDEVAFHEVGAVDSIVDIVGAAIALDELRPKSVSSRPIPLGHGSTHCAHGRLPVPSPAALAILVGCEVEDGGVGRELCTPTGAAIVAATVDAGFGELPAGTLIATGYGAGDAELDDRPNHLRLVLLERAASRAAAMVIEANVDDMSPELSAHLLDRLFDAGAKDVWLTPIVMKKGRPAATIAALCAPADRARLSQRMLRESTSIGLRYYPVERWTLARKQVDVETSYGTVTIKEAYDEAGRRLNAAPEFESCRQRAAEAGVPIKEVFAAAIAAHRVLAPSGEVGLGSDVGSDL